MEEQEKDLMERYIYEVIRRVPKAQRDEIRLELQELIGDMCEQEGMTMEAILLKLGDPAEFAKRYREEPGHLIGPEYYDNYIWVMKIVLICVILSSLVSSVVNGLAVPDPSEDFIKGTMDWVVNRIPELIGGSLISFLSAFGSVTLIFAIFERCKVKVTLKEQKEWKVDHLMEHAVPASRWTPGRLAPVPDKRALISRGESLASLVFLLLFGGIMILAPRLFGAYVLDGDKLIRIIPVFNLEIWGTILPILILNLLVSFADEMVRLITGCYCRLVMICKIIDDVIELFLVFLLLRVLPLFNPDFIEEVSAVFGYRPSSRADLMYYWGSDLFNNVIFAIFCAILLLDMGTTIYKTLRYGTKSEVSKEK